MIRTLGILIEPHIGGTFSVFINMRRGLQPMGWQVRYVFPDTNMAGGLVKKETAGERIGVRGLSSAAGTIELIKHLSKYQIVAANVLTDHLSMNSIRYLPSQVRRMMIVHNITFGTYAAARALRPWVHRTVAVSWRIEEDLLKSQGFKKETTSVVPNAIGIPLGPIKKRFSGPFRVLSLGRLEERSKGIFELPRLWRMFNSSAACLDIYGAGPDREELVNRCNDKKNIRLRGEVKFSKRVNVFMPYHVFLFPSRYEGFGMTLVEAMACGCVPIARRIRGVTDRIITHGQDGFLFDHLAEGVQALKILEGNRFQLRRMSQAAERSSRKSFNLKIISRLWAKELEALLDESGSIKPLPLDHFSYPSEFRSSLRAYFPGWVKKMGYKILAR